MNANDLTFGIEIETLIDDERANANGLQIGSYRRGLQVAYLPEGWTASRDASLSGESDDLSCEIVSPILQGAEGLEQVVSVARTLQNKGHKVNSTCGVHVHVGFAGRTEKELLNLYQCVSYLEKALYAASGTKSRERGRFCQSVRRFGGAACALRMGKADRYRILNATNLTPNGKQTVEFRVFSGSLNPVKLAGWIQAVLGIVERASTLKRLPSWTPQPAQGGWRKNGVGQTDVERLFGFLGWGDGYRKLKGGKTFGKISDAISENAIKAEFRRLAQKYDAQI